MNRHRLWALGPLWGIGAALGCASTPAPPANAPPDPAQDAKAVLAQELGEAPAPQGPCPERTEPNVLGNPRAPVQRTALGLAYCILREGPAGNAVPTAEDTVRVHYSGWTEDGELFDSSVERGEPIDFALNTVIRGWGEGLRLMTPGDKARLWIPGNLAYGRREPGASAGTPPKGTLIFDVELLEVVRADAETSEAASETSSKPPLTMRPEPGAQTTPKRDGPRKPRPSVFSPNQ